MTFTCSKSTMESPEQTVKSVWRYQEINSSGIFTVTIWTYFTLCSGVSIDDFEKTNAGLEHFFRAKYYFLAELKINCLNLLLLNFNLV